MPGAQRQRDRDQVRRRALGVVALAAAKRREHADRAAPGSRRAWWRIGLGRPLVPDVQVTNASSGCVGAPTGERPVVPSRIDDRRRAGSRRRSRPTSAAGCRGFTGTNTASASQHAEQGRDQPSVRSGAAPPQPIPAARRGRAARCRSRPLPPEPRRPSPTPSPCAATPPASGTDAPRGAEASVITTFQLGALLGEGGAGLPPGRGGPTSTPARWAPAVQASVSPCSSAAHSAFFVAAMAAGELLAIVSPSSWARSRRRSGGSTISVIIPSS